MLRMFVILAYDVGKERVTKVMKICRKYLHHIQKSVFEGIITDAKLEKLKNELKQCVNFAEDKVCVYKFASLKYSGKEELGAACISENIL